MASVAYDPMSSQLLDALPELKQIADRIFGIEGVEVVEENPYSVLGAVLAPQIDELLDAPSSPTRHEALQRIFAALEAFIADPQWSSGGYNYADNVVALEIIEHLMSRGSEERLRLARPYLGPLVAQSLAEMEAWWDQERQRQIKTDLPSSVEREGKKKRSTTKDERVPIKRRAR